MAPPIDNDHFLTELTKMFQQSRLGGPGSVSISMKRYDGRTKPLPKADKEPSTRTLASGGGGDPRCLFHAKLGRKKISTIVNPKDVNKFQLAYANVLKANMDNLKKRERKSAAENSAKVAKK